MVMVLLQTIENQDTGILFKHNGPKGKIAIESNKVNLTYWSEKYLFCILKCD